MSKNFVDRQSVKRLAEKKETSHDSKSARALAGKVEVLDDEFESEFGDYPTRPSDRELLGEDF